MPRNVYVSLHVCTCACKSVVESCSDTSAWNACAGSSPLYLTCTLVLLFSISHARDAGIISTRTDCHTRKHMHAQFVIPLHKEVWHAITLPRYLLRGVCVQKTVQRLHAALANMANNGMCSMKCWGAECRDPGMRMQGSRDENAGIQG